MIYLISGASHTGKTVLAQHLLERLHVPYLSLDHLKMGLIRSGMTTLTPADDDRMTGFLFPIAAEIIKTAPLPFWAGERFSVTEIGPEASQ